MNNICCIDILEIIPPESKNDYTKYKRKTLTVKIGDINNKKSCIEKINKNLQSYIKKSSADIGVTYNFSFFIYDGNDDLNKEKMFYLPSFTTKCDDNIQEFIYRAFEQMYKNCEEMKKEETYYPQNICDVVTNIINTHSSIKTVAEKVLECN